MYFFDLPSQIEKLFMCLCYATPISLGPVFIKGVDLPLFDCAVGYRLIGVANELIWQLDWLGLVRMVVVAVLEPPRKSHQHQLCIRAIIILNVSSRMRGQKPVGHGNLAP